MADHSWNTAFLYLIIAENEDLDIAEAATGNIAHRAVDTEQEFSSEEKAELEEKAVKELAAGINGDFRQLWQEYEERETGESRFVKDMDLIDMCLQALKYEKQGRYDKNEENGNFQQYDDLDEFFATSRPRLTTDTGKQLFNDIKGRYEEAKKE